MKNKLFILEMFCLALIAFFTTKSFAQDIYKYVDELGVIHYSTKPSKAGDRPVKLPKIKHQNLDKTIDSIKGSSLPTCVSHGGIDCQAGQDKDGSVICVDGFTGAVRPFRFRCMESKLKEASFVVFNKNNQPVAKNTLGNIGVSELILSVHNNSSVKSYGISVSFFFKNKKEVKASGPQSIEPYGIGEYILKLNGVSVDLSELAYKVSCTNCKVSLQGRYKQ